MLTAFSGGLLWLAGQNQKRARVRDRRHLEFGSVGIGESGEIVPQLEPNVAAVATVEAEAAVSEAVGKLFASEVQVLEAAVAAAGAVVAVVTVLKYLH